MGIMQNTNGFCGFPFEKWEIPDKNHEKFVKMFPINWPKVLITQIQFQKNYVMLKIFQH